MADRPTPADWKKYFPELRQTKAQLEGPCPNCGETGHSDSTGPVDRFTVKLNPPYLFNCRQCDDGAAILKAYRTAVKAESAPAPSGFTFERVWEYVGADGTPRYVHRKDLPDGSKRIWQRPQGADFTGVHIRLFSPKGVDENTDPVILCEGEKAAEAIRNAGYVGASYIGGAKKAGAADYSILEDRRVVVWPDADGAGIRAACIAADRLIAVGAGVSVVVIEDGEAKGADAADYPVEEIIRRVQAAISYNPAIFDDGNGSNGDNPFLRGKEYKPVLTSDLQRIASSWHNAANALIDSGWADGLWWDLWAATPRHTDIPPMSHEDLDVQAKGIVEESGYSPTERAVLDAIKVVAQRNPRDPVKEKLQKWAADWDGVERVRNLGRLYANTEDRLSNEIFALIVLGQVGRAEYPGAVFDYCPVIYSNGEGKGKGFSLKSLSLNGYATGLNLDSREFERDAGLRFQQASLVELGEITASRQHEATLKAFTSQNSLIYRTPYDRLPREYPVRSIIAATTNKRSIVREGENRRWPIFELKGEIDWRAIEADRQHIFGEAYILVKELQPFTLGGKEVVQIALPPDLWDEAKQRTAEFQVGDDWGDGLLEAMQEGQFKDVTGQIYVLASTVSEYTKGRRVSSNAVHDLLTHAGYSRKKQRVDGKTKAVWVLDGVTAVTGVTTDVHIPVGEKHTEKTVCNPPMESGESAVTAVTAVTGNICTGCGATLMGWESNPCGICQG